MAHLYICSPSSAVRDKDAFRRGIQRLKALCHSVEVDPTALKSHTRFAGDDESRLAAIERAARSGADAVLTSRGGYGLSRLLPSLPYQAMAASVAQGTRWIGLSDFTALQLALLARTGAATWAGPCVVEDFGALEPDEITEACFNELLDGSAEGVGWRLPAGDAKAYSALGLDKAEIPWPPSRSASGVLWGGNLSVLCSMLGTPFFPAIKGGFLFLEDVNEHPYRIERMLLQLQQAGVLDQQKAVLLGAFNRYKLADHDKGYSLAKAIALIRERSKTPVFTGLPFGHVPTKVCLPVGLKVRLLVQQRDALLIWG